jgi:SAM-dependent methyltransferase
LYHHQSYYKHGNWYNQYFPGKESKINYYKEKRSLGKKTIAHWLQDIFFSCIDPLLEENKHWLTVGDAYGFDAQYIESRGSVAMATDLNVDFLVVAQEEGIIARYKAENAEQLSFPDEHFDYVLCKESYHHFPRPYAALYEMIRVAKKGIVIIEPQDPVTKMPMLLWFFNLFKTKPQLLNRIWKNRFSYEPVGNFVYKVSEREFEKFAAGLNLPVLAFKRINPNFYFKGAEVLTQKKYNGRFMKIKVKKAIMDILLKCRLFPGQVLCTVVFKTIPENSLLQQMKAEGYHFVHIPENPYATL